MGDIMPSNPDHSPASAPLRVPVDGFGFLQQREEFRAVASDIVAERTLVNVAGSRGSKEPGVAAFVKRDLEDAFYPRVEGMVLRG